MEGFLRMRKYIYILLAICFLPCFNYAKSADKISWIKEDSREWFFITQKDDKLLYKLQRNYDVSGFCFIEKKTGDAIWEENSDINKTHPSILPYEAVIETNLIFYDLSIGRLCCFNYMDGSLKWRIKNNSILNYYNNIVCNNKLYYYKNRYTDKISIIELNKDTGEITKEILIDLPILEYKQTSYSFNTILYIDNNNIYFILEKTIHCYNFKMKKYLWNKRQGSLYDTSYNYYNNMIIYATSRIPSPMLWEYRIVGINAETGKDVFEFDGSREFYIENNVIYYYSYEFWNKDTVYTKCIGAYSIVEKKDIYKYGNKQMFFRYDGFFMYETGLVQLCDSPRENIHDKANIYNKYLKLIDTIEFPFDLGKYYTTNDCLIGIREWRMGNEIKSYTICCYNLPKNKLPDPPKKEIPKIPLNFITWILRFIFGKLTLQP